MPVCACLDVCVSSREHIHVRTCLCVSLCVCTHALQRAVQVEGQWSEGGVVAGDPPSPPGAKQGQGDPQAGTLVWAGGGSGPRSRSGMLLRHL